MTISAKIIADSISVASKRITTMQLRYPRFVHAEFMTHRVFSRNAASSRAIPVEKMIADVMDDPAMPVYWGKNQKGMQADEEMPEAQIKLLKGKWLCGRNDAVDLARTLMQDGLHKQIANRVLEPWFHINTLVTATEWDNFFELRIHKDAQPEIRELAHCMKVAMNASPPAVIERGEWHLPYVTKAEQKTFSSELCLKLSVARCARVSYLTQEGKMPRIDEDIALYDRLVGGVPLHASPAEHQATPDTLLDVMGRKEWQNMDQWRNFRGWIQYRAKID